ncbi:MAG: DUF1501 domain-containing protein [Acidobacteria bacterium]|nr:DUF1501 domain-containing protein [Acidobacteriota bacterium]MCI0627301.1 DUF1501 domain-containing protein [Acidobacteriota bacterium]MCI0722896.1 DUF1501 domain-containing protein [Acidobacteriota bacterium]
MDTTQCRLLETTRRHFFGQCAVGLGQIALASLLRDGEMHGAQRTQPVNPRASKPPHFAPKAKSVIYLFMAGGPSQLDLFEHKPKLVALSGQPIPESFLKGKRFAFMDSFSREVPKLLGSRRQFQRYGQSSRYVSECLPHLGRVADDLAFVSSVYTDNFNHAPAKIFLNTGSTRFGRPSLGAWVTYGIGSESQDLPGFVVLQSGPRGPRAGALNWGSGFLPTAHQGVPFQSGGDPILNLTSPKGFNSERQQQVLQTVRDLNRAHLKETGDPEIATRIASYEMAYRMQTSGPELIDFSKESKETLALYGAEPRARSFANNCLLARRLVERGVRFVQLYHTDWDQHGGPDTNLNESLDQICQQIDRPCAALIQDLKQRGLLDQTLVVWGGEFGRTPMGEQRETLGRNHHIDAFTMWFAGAGIKPGQTVGSTDELGFNTTEDKVHVHDIQATILHLLGLDHTQLTFKFQGRDFRLTDVSGDVIKKLLA